jgi:hypothetical protein
VKNDDNQSDSKKTGASAHQVTLNRMKKITKVGEDITGLTNNSDPDEKATKYEEIAP